MRLGRLLYPEAATAERPYQRSQCIDGPRPCPWVGCKFNNYLSVNPETGSIKLNFPDVEPWEVKDSCVLDVADEGGCTLEEVGAIMNVTRERIHQLEMAALAKLGEEADLLEAASWEEQ